MVQRVLTENDIVYEPYLPSPQASISKMHVGIPYSIMSSHLLRPRQSRFTLFKCIHLDRYDYAFENSLLTLPVAYNNEYKV